MWHATYALRVTLYFNGITLHDNVRKINKIHDNFFYCWNSWQYRKFRHITWRNKQFTLNENRPSPTEKSRLSPLFFLSNFPHNKEALHPASSTPICHIGFLLEARHTVINTSTDISSFCSNDSSISLLIAIGW